MHRHARLLCHALKQWGSAPGKLPRAFYFGSEACAEASPPGQSVIGAYTPVTKKLWSERLQKDQSKSLLESSPPPTPVPKPPSVSSVTYPFSTDFELQEQYRNPWNRMRMGRVLEDLDSLAGNVAWAHCDDGKPETRPPLLVTASVDAISLRHSLQLDNSMRMAGRVVWTGKSSMDIRMELTQDAYGSDPSVVALFTFVARDPVTQKAMPINPVVPQTAEDRALFEERQRIADERRAARAANPDGQRPVSQGAQQKVATLLDEARTLRHLPALAGGDSVLMRDTELQNTFTCQPQQRNMHGRVFGGFLMRRAYELAFATSYMFAGSRPRFVQVDEVTFQRPVDVGDLLQFRSAVVHTSWDQDKGEGRLHVEVAASVTQPERVRSHLTNTFRFVFAVARPAAAEGGGAGPGRPLRRVLPSSGEEASRMLPFLSG